MLESLCTSVDAALRRISAQFSAGYVLGLFRRLHAYSPRIARRYVRTSDRRYDVSYFRVRTISIPRAADFLSGSLYTV